MNKQSLTNLNADPFNGRFLDLASFRNGIDSALMQEVQTGLIKIPKQVSSRFLYDAEGSRIFQAIMHSPEYYLTRSEHEILTTHKTDLVQLFTANGYGVDLIDLGAGDGLKTRILLDELWSNQGIRSYIPVDVSEDTLTDLVASIDQQWPALPVRPQPTDYLMALDQIAIDRQPAELVARQVVLFLGSNIGNFTSTEALNFYQNLSTRLRHGDLVLTGFDLQKHPAIIYAAYNDRQGLTKAFNLNLLQRINRELQADFDLLAFDHYESYNPENGEARSYLVSQKDQVVHIPSIGMAISFAYGEIIHTEISRKFTPVQIEELAQSTGFSVSASFTDCNGYFVDVVFQKQ